MGSAYCEAFGDVLVIDPILPPPGVERERFWRALDRDVARIARALQIVLTCPWHARGSGEIAARYPEATLHMPKPGDVVAGRVVAIEAVLEDEVLLWLPSHQALVAGETLVGDGAGGVRLEGADDAARAALRERLSELPVEYILPSHGAPVLSGARQALARSLT